MGKKGVEICFMCFLFITFPCVSQIEFLLKAISVKEKKSYCKKDFMFNLELWRKIILLKGYINM